MFYLNQTSDLNPRQISLQVVIILGQIEETGRSLRVGTMVPSVRKVPAEHLQNAVFRGTAVQSLASLFCIDESSKLKEKRKGKEMKIDLIFRSDTILHNAW